MKSLCFVFGILVGVIFGGIVTLNGACNSKDHYDAAVIGLIEQLDEDYVLDTLCETDAWAELCNYVNLSNY